MNSSSTITTTTGPPSPVVSTTTQYVNHNSNNPNDQQQQQKQPQNEQGVSVGLVSALVAGGIILMFLIGFLYIKYEWRKNANHKHEESSSFPGKFSAPGAAASSAAGSSSSYVAFRPSDEEVIRHGGPKNLTRKTSDNFWETGFWWDPRRARAKVMASYLDIPRGASAAAFHPALMTDEDREREAEFNRRIAFASKSPPPSTIGLSSSSSPLKKARSTLTPRSCGDGSGGGESMKKVKKDVSGGGGFTARHYTTSSPPSSSGSSSSFAGGDDQREIRRIAARAMRNKNNNNNNNSGRFRNQQGNNNNDDDDDPLNDVDDVKVFIPEVKPFGQ